MKLCQFYLGLTGTEEIENFLDEISSVLCEVSELPSRMMKIQCFWPKDRK